MRNYLVLALLVAGAAPSPAAQAEFQLQQAAPYLSERVLHLNSLLDLKLSPRAEEALHKGIPLEIVVEVRVIQHRWWWANKVISDWDLRRRLLFHALSRQYIVTRLFPADAPQSFSTLEQALIDLGRLDDVKLLLTARKTFYPDARYLVEFRARLNIEALPALMRPLAYVTPSWRLSTGWHQWPVQP